MVVISRIGYRLVSARCEPTSIRTTAKPHSQRVNREAATSGKKEPLTRVLRGRPREGSGSPVPRLTASGVTHATTRSLTQTMRRATIWAVCPPSAVSVAFDERHWARLDLTRGLSTQNFMGPFLTSLS